MSNAADMLPGYIRAAATAIANARAGRRGAPAIANILENLPQDLFIQVVEDAHAAIKAADSAREAAANTPTPRQRGPLCAADAEALRLDLGATTLLILARDRASRASGALTSIFGTTLVGHDTAQTLWGAVAARIRDEAAAAESSPSTESQELTA